MRCARILTLMLLVGCLADLPREASAYSVETFVSQTFDPSRSREIAFTLYYPVDFEGTASVLIFSHGGFGSPTGHTLYGHFGWHWAQAGYVGIHVNHLASSPPGLHSVDRPRDVSFVLDQLQAGMLPLPAGFTGSLDLTAFGHAGHSYGAYTAMALAGGDFAGYPTFRDPRIVAIAPISPQGADQFGAYDDGPTSNTWSAIEIPAFNLVGGAEKDTNAIGTIFEEDWRLTPFERYPSARDKFQVILPEQDHSDMGVFASAANQVYLGENTRLFFDVYLKGETSGTCLIGSLPAFPDQILLAKSDPTVGIATLCPPPIGVPEPTGWLVALSWLLALGSRSGRVTTWANVS